MAGFSLRKGTAEVEEWTLTATGTSHAIGDLLMWTAGTGTAAAATSSGISYDKLGVVTKSNATTDTTVMVQVVKPGSEQTWEVQSNASSSSDHNGDAMVLTDKNTVNNSGTNSTAKEALVIQIAPVRAASDKLILVQFVGAPYGLTYNAT